MMTLRRPLAALVMAAHLPAAVLAKLDVGSPAPEARPKVMIQGEAVGKLDDSKTYLFEFWATWCGPCVQMVPHLNELDKEFGPKGLVVLGTSVWEDDPAKVAAFVKARGEKMGYRVGFDADESMVNGWVEAAGVDGIPHACVVQKGKILWAGHPAQLTAKLVASFIDGTYSPGQAEADWAKLEEKIQALGMAVQAKQWDKAEALLAETLPLMPEADRAQLGEHVGGMIALGRGDPSRIYKRLAAVAEKAKDDLTIQCDIAWKLATDPDFEGKRDLALASKLAERALQLAEHADLRAYCLELLARIRFLQGKKEEAVRLQQQSLDTVREPCKISRQILECYKKGELPPASRASDEGE